jgi:hypothetical protein
MTTIDLGTTNLLLGILAAVSVLEMVALVAAGIMGYRLYTNAMTTIRELEARHVSPIVGRVNAILTDVKGVTERVNSQTERADAALHRTIDRVDETAERVKWTVRSKAEILVGVVRDVRGAIEQFLAGRHHSTSAAADQARG